MPKRFSVLSQKMPRRAVAGVDHQQMIARTADREDRGRDGVQARRHGDAPRAAFQRLDGALEAAAGRRAAAAIFVRLALGLQRLDIGKEDRGGAIDRRVDRAEMLGGHAPCRNRDRFRPFLLVAHGSKLRLHGRRCQRLFGLGFQRRACSGLSNSPCHERRDKCQSGAEQEEAHLVHAAEKLPI